MVCLQYILLFGYAFENIAVIAGRMAQKKKMTYVKFSRLIFTDFDVLLYTVRKSDLSFSFVHTLKKWTFIFLPRNSKKCPSFSLLLHSERSSFLLLNLTLSKRSFRKNGYILKFCQGQGIPYRKRNLRQSFTHRLLPSQKNLLFRPSFLISIHPLLHTSSFTLFLDSQMYNCSYSVCVHCTIHCTVNNVINDDRMVCFQYILLFGLRF